MEGREDLYDGQFGVALVGRRGALHAQSRRRCSPGTALARVRARDQIPLGEDHPRTRVSSEVVSLFVFSAHWTGVAVYDARVRDCTRARIHVYIKLQNKVACESSSSELLESLVTFHPSCGDRPGRLPSFLCDMSYLAWSR